MKQRIKQICASFLAVMMVITYMPAMAFAGSAGVDWSEDHKTFVYGEQSYEAVETKVDPTCTEAGYTLYEAKVGDEVKDSFKVAGEAALGHDLGEAEDVIDVEATCTADGSKHTEAKCQREGCTYVEKSDAIVIPKVSHEETEEPVKENEVAATCSAEGSYDDVYYCRFGCGTELRREHQTVDKTDHDWVLDGEKSVAATCDKEGLNVYKCADCEETKEEVVEKIEHEAADAVQENVVEPTCTEQGSYDSVVYCKNCGEELSREAVVTNELGHKVDPEDKGTVKKEATCEEDGILAFKCTVCGEDVEEAIPALGHKEGEPVEFVKTEATCTEDGEKVVTVSCTVCGKELSHEEGVVIPATGHQWSEEPTEVVEEATCTEAGSGIYTCEACGATKEDVIPALGHTEGEAVKENIVDATCEAEGSYEEVVYCTVCDAEISRETKTVPALGHDWVKDEKASVAAKCGVEGKDVFKCSRCEETKEETLEALEHNYVKDEDVSREATCAKDGEFVEVCSLCGDVHKEVVPKETVEHTLSKVEAVDPTCQTAGNVEYFKCSVCGKLFVLEGEGEDAEYVEKSLEEVTLAADPEAHVWDEGTVTKEATCTEDGSKVFKCTCVAGKDAEGKDVLCEAEKTETIPALGHDWNRKVVKKATCTEDGSAYGICKRCEEVQENIVIPARDHKWSEKAVSAKIYWSETEPGTGSVEYTYVCENEADDDYAACSEKDVRIDKFEYTEEPAEDQDYVLTYETTKEPGCEEVGEGTYTFKSAVLKDGTRQTSTYKVVEEATGHAWGEVQKENEVEATCTESGSYETVIYCDNCGLEKENSRQSVKVAPLGHDWPVDENGEAITTKVYTNSEDQEDYDPSKPTTYNIVRTCARCGEEEILQKDIVEDVDHPGVQKIENNVDPTCEEDGSYDIVIYCENHGEELARTTIVAPAKGHNDGGAEYDEETGEWYNGGNWVLNEEESVEVTCTEDGEDVWDLVCLDCGEVLDTRYETVWAEGHKAEFTKQHVLVQEATATEDGYYADVTYCGMCGEVLAEINKEVIPAKNVADKAAELKAEADAVDPAAYPEDQQEAVKAAKDALAEAAADPDATAADLDEAKAEFDKAMEAPNAAKAEADAAQAAAEEEAAAAKKAADEAKAAADKAAEEAAKAEAGTQDAVDKAAAAKAAADDAAAKAEAAKAAAEKAYGADSEEAKAAAEAAEAAKTAAATAADNATKAEAAKAEADKKSEEEKAAAEAEKAKADAAAAQTAAEKVTASDYTADSVKAVAAAKAALDEAVKGGDTAKINEATKALNDSVAAAKKKAANTLQVKAKTVKAKNAKKTTIKKAKAFKVTGAKGKVTFKKVKGNKKIKVSKAGKITVKKGLKKGKTYTIKVKVTASGNGNYKAGSKTVKLKIKVK